MESASNTFKLANLFIDQYLPSQRTPDFGPLGEIVFRRTYARRLPNGRQEEWYQTCQRVIEGMYSILQDHCLQNNIYWDADKADNSAEEAYDRLFDMKWLPPGRGLANMGTDTVRQKGGAVLCNCSFYSTKDIDKDFARPFTFLMDMLMLGVGVGTDVRGAGKVMLHPPSISGDYVVADTREGWVDLVRTILKAYIDRGTIPKTIDFGQLRAKGTPLNAMGGVSSGPDPLIRLTKDLVYVLNDYSGRVSVDGSGTLYQLSGEPDGPSTLITSAHITDIANYIGKCVVSGGVRRSSEIVLGPEDQEFMDLKLDKGALADRRWASNNSVVIEPSPYQDYASIASRIVTNGEPGILWLDNTRKFGRMIDGPDYKDMEVDGVNPCSEIGLLSAEVCNVAESFPARHKDQFDYWRTLKFVYLYSKAVTLIPIHDWETHSIVQRNRRIGTSMSGIQQAISRFGLRDFTHWFCNTGYTVIRNWDAVYSDWLQIPESIRVTAIKPSGTVSLLPGATPGIHLAHSQFYIRRVRIEDTSTLLGPLTCAGYHIEPAINETATMVVEIPVHEHDFIKGKNDATVEEQFELAALIQKHWADNQVSVTITFDKETEGWKIPRLLHDYQDKLKSVSLLPRSGHGYKQLPYEEITYEQYTLMAARLSKPVFNDGQQIESSEKFCDGESCMV